MSAAVVYTRAATGLHAAPIRVETNLSSSGSGNGQFLIVGLAETAVKESRERVRGAIQNANFQFPYDFITVNLAPADLPKQGGGFDLPIALSILAASGQIPMPPADIEWLGELSLLGDIQPVQQLLPMLMSLTERQKRLVIPSGNAHEASLIQGLKIAHSKHLLEITNYLTNGEPLDIIRHYKQTSVAKKTADPLKDVIGQTRAKRALTIAASGGHNVLFLGPPGSGKTMLAERFRDLLPPLNNKKAIESAAIESAAGQKTEYDLIYQPRLRAPHHTSSAVALIGGGSQAKPGEISLANHGVLLLDELPEFERRVLEVLREPLESRQITIARAAKQVTYPADFQLIATMNPCPCGFYGVSQATENLKPCRCRPDQIKRYLQKLSGPLVDRIDIQVEVAAVSKSVIEKTLTKRSEKNNNQKNAPDEMSDAKTMALTTQIAHCQQLQINRQGKLNAALGSLELQQYAALNDTDATWLCESVDKLSLSVRATHRVWRIARTIADLSGEDHITRQHLLEALNYRQLEKLQAHVMG